MNFHRLAKSPPRNKLMIIAFQSTSLPVISTRTSRIIALNPSARKLRSMNPRSLRAMIGTGILDLTSRAALTPGVLAYWKLPFVATHWRPKLSRAATRAAARFPTGLQTLKRPRCADAWASVQIWIQNYRRSCRGSSEKKCESLPT